MGQKDYIRFKSHVEWLCESLLSRAGVYWSNITSISGYVNVISAENNTTRAGCEKSLSVLLNYTFTRNSTFVNYLSANIHSRIGWTIFVKRYGESSKHLLGSAARYARVSRLACLKIVIIQRIPRLRLLTSPNCAHRFSVWRCCLCFFKTWFTFNILFVHHDMITSKNISSSLALLQLIFLGGHNTFWISQ